MRNLGDPSSSGILELAVSEEDDGVRLDKFLSLRAPYRSRSWFKRRLADGHVTVDGEVSRAARKVRAGQQVVVEIGPDDRPDRGAHLGSLDDLPLDVAFEDEHLVVCNKPAGMVAHPVGGYRYLTLINVLHRHYRNVEDPANDRVPTLVNRLDKQTSGLMVACLSDLVRPPMAALFADHSQVQKRYLAIVEGLVAEEEGVWDGALGPDVGHHVRMRRAVKEDGQPSRTRYRVRERIEGDTPATLLEVTLETGRKHQIRVHAAHAGHPILCDHVYGDLRDPTYYEDEDPEAFAAHLETLPIQRHALHAWELTFPHPLTGESVRATAPLPADMERALVILRGEGVL